MDQNKSPVRRVTLSIPPELADQLDAVSAFLRVSRSSLVTAVLLPAVGQMQALLNSVEFTHDGQVDGRKFQRAAYDQLDALERMLGEVRYDATKLQ
jgi:hypothetical protein